MDMKPRTASPLLLSLSLLSFSFVDINNPTSQTYDVSLAPFADDTCLQIYATECKKGFGLRKIRRVLDSVAA
jgi:hypothetical protein